MTNSIAIILKITNYTAIIVKISDSIDIILKITNSNVIFLKITNSLVIRSCIFFTCKIVIPSINGKRYCFTIHCSVSAG